MRKIYLGSAAVFLISLVYSGQAFGVQFDYVSTVGMKLHGEEADWAYLFLGNDSNTNLNDPGIVPDTFGTGEFYLLDKVVGENDDTYTSLGGFDWTLGVKSVGESEGTYTLEWDDSGDVPQTFDFLFALKAQTGYALYLFNDETITYKPGFYDGAWEVQFRISGNSNDSPELSHMSAYGRLGDAPDPTPEPATMLLFGTGLAGIAGIRRRMKK